MLRFLSILGFLLALPFIPVAAQDYHVECNVDGYVVTPMGERPVYLGKSCDAYHEGLGGGRWCRESSSVKLSFARGDSEIDLKLPACKAVSKNCGCPE